MAGKIADCSHPHKLSYSIDAAGKKCQACLKYIDHGLRYLSCGQKRCKFWLHKWCSEQPLEITYPFHPHKLEIQFSMRNLLKEETDRCWVCDECSFPPSGYCYVCRECKFFIHLSCASPTIDRHGDRLKRVSLNHPSHTKGALSLFQVREIFDFRPKNRRSIYSIRCNWCSKNISDGMCYACLACLAYVGVSPCFHHKDCADFKVVPLKIRHPSHKAHILRFSWKYRYKYKYRHKQCGACKCVIDSSSAAYCCGECDLPFHPSCITRYLPSFKYESHDHMLTYIEYEHFDWGFDSHYSCCDASFSFGDESSASGFYRCIECDKNFHLSCILPDTKKHKYHWHPLALMNPTKEDDKDESYCDICENKRHPDHYVYSCKEECTYCVAHIECAFGQERTHLLDLALRDPSLALQSLEVKDGSDEVSSKEGSDGEIQMHHPAHRHILTMSPCRRGILDVTCDCCRQRIYTLAFVCKTCEKYNLHKECAELTRDKLLQSPLHSHHPLTLRFKSSFSRFICDACGEVKDAKCFHYQCQDCKFIVDLKCVTSHVSLSPSQVFKKLDQVYHFSHQHKLHLGNTSEVGCHYCFSQITGLGYFCLFCDFSFHKSCLREIPRELKVSPHSSSHSFSITNSICKHRGKATCFACGTKTECCHALMYNCVECGNSFVHSACAVSLRHPLKYSSHNNHEIHYFWRDINMMLKSFDGYKWFECNKCSEYCVEAFYRCLECEVNFHLKCVIPQVVKSKYHRHPVKLVDPFIVEGYDPEEQYCDVCEEKRDPNHHVYRCEDCSDSFIGHINCVLSKTEKIMEEARHASSNNVRNNLAPNCEYPFWNQTFKPRIEEETFHPLYDLYEDDDDDKIIYVDIHPTKPWILLCIPYMVIIWNYQIQNRHDKKLQFEKHFKATSPEAKFISWEDKNWVAIKLFGDEIIFIYDCETSEKLYQLKAHTSQVMRLYVNPGHPYLFLSLKNGHIKYWGWKKSRLYSKEFIGLCPIGFNSSLGVEFNLKDPNIFASTTRDGILMIWNMDSSYPAHAIRAHDEELTSFRSIIINGDEPYLLGVLRAPDKDPIIKIWDFISANCVIQIDAGKQFRGNFIPMEPPIIYRKIGEAIEIWNATNNRLEKKLDFSFGKQKSISYSKCSNHVLLHYEEGLVLVKIINSGDLYSLDDVVEEAESSAEEECSEEDSSEMEYFTGGSDTDGQPFEMDLN